MVAVFGSDYASPRFADNRQGVGGVDGEPRPARELRLPRGVGRRRFEHIVARRLVGRTEASIQL